MRLIETDTNANKDINAAVSVGAYTATTTRGVIVRLLADQVAGGGDYIAYVTVQLAGAGSHYRIIPLTTGTAAAALTAIGFVSIPIPVNASDVLTVYIDGLAGDTTTPDVRVDFYEQDYMRAILTGIVGTYTNTTTITLAAAATADVDAYNGCQINFVGGTGAGQSRIIVDYSVTTKVATLYPALTTALDTTTVYQIVGGAADVKLWLGAAAPAMTGDAYAILTSAIPDSYSAAGDQPTMRQAILETRQFLQERIVSGVNVTVRKPNGSTTAMTFLLDDGTNPTEITRNV